MFGLFKNRFRWREISAGAEIGAAFEPLHRDAPGAAYLFARTLVNARPLLDDLTLSAKQKVEAIQAEIDASNEPSRPHERICALAMKMTRRLVELAERDVVASSGYLAAFRRITSAGEQYRSLEPRDHQPPEDQGSREILARQGRTCVAEVIDAIVTESENESHDRQRTAEDIATVLALFDLRAEAYSGRLQSVLPALEAAVNGPTSRLGA